jgi:hypothetical protein
VTVEPTELDAQGWRLFGGLHRLLLRLAGRVPDDLLTHCRTLLGTVDVDYLPDTLAGTLAQLGVPLRADDIALLREASAQFGSPGAPTGIDAVPLAEEVPATGHRFFPAPPGVLATAGARIPPALDLTGGDPEDFTVLPPHLAHLSDLAYDLTDAVDARMADFVAVRDATVAVGRAWRFDPSGRAAEPRRVFLIEVDPGVWAWTLTDEAQRELVRKGEPDPQVEVFWTGDDLPPYHLAARAGSARLWARSV